MSLSVSRSPRTRSRSPSCCDISQQSERFGNDGSPKSLQAYLESVGPTLTFKFRQSRKSGYQSLEDDCDRRVMGSSTKFEMVSGKFELSEEVTTTQLVDGKYSLAPLYKIDLNLELVCHVGVVAGEKVPIITDRNPHLENLLDSKRCIYLPQSEDANVVVDLPNNSGMFFTTQRLTGADCYVCYDRSLHKHWVIVINNVYSKHNLSPDYGSGQEKLWKKLVEHQAYNDRVMELLTRLGNHVKILFRDELMSDRDVESSYYLYERSGLVYGHYDGSWHFGVKDLSSCNGVKISLKGQEKMEILHKPIRHAL